MALLHLVLDWCPWLNFSVCLFRWSSRLLFQSFLPVTPFGRLSRLVSSFCLLGRSFSRFLVFLVRFLFLAVSDAWLGWSSRFALSLLLLASSLRLIFSVSRLGWHFCLVSGFWPTGLHAIKNGQASGTSRRHRPREYSNYRRAASLFIWSIASDLNGLPPLRGRSREGRSLRIIYIGSVANHLRFMLWDWDAIN